MSPEAIEFPACSPKSSPNGTNLSELFNAEGTDLAHVGDLFACSKGHVKRGGSVERCLSGLWHKCHENLEAELFKVSHGIEVSSLLGCGSWAR